MQQPDAEGETDCCGAAGVAHGGPPKENSMKRPIAFVGSFVIVAIGLSLSADAASRDRAIILAQGAPPEICTEVYQPVCGTNPGGMRVTYSNACFARAGKATNVSPGECAK
jgi:Kazal-type serine protease inhibitor domain